ncbi:hypothetical protein MTR67_051673 [Solanum verrucosum]|uniref:ATP-dependent DNA helicase n=1 Tax=Solanum verrucosum TaxID=315347 RepID=A0AAF0V7U5_SOLVR|nr:hypothetical protein MTR67_051673 [Solanum verrucosum]
MLFGVKRPYFHGRAIVPCLNNVRSSGTSKFQRSEALTGGHVNRSMRFTMQLLLLSIAICSLARNLLPPWFVVGRRRVPLCTVLLLLGTRNTKAFHSQVCLSHLRYQEVQLLPTDSAVGQSTRHALSQKLLPLPHSSLTTSAEEQLIECLRNRLILQDQHPQHVMTVPAYFPHKPQPTVKGATVRSKGFIALATATSGVAASVLPGGRTAHSRFKLPIDIRDNHG